MDRIAPSTETGLTQAALEAGLRDLGLTRGAAVEVHSSLSSLGQVEGGAATVVDALMAVVGEAGTLAMPAFPISKPLPLTAEEKARGILAKAQLYGLDYDGPTGMGVIADELRRRPGAIVGPGFHRVCAWGRDAERLSAGFGALVEADAWALLLGVNIERCSSMHHAERVGLPDEVTRCFAIPDDIRRDYPDDIFIQYGRTPDRAWLKIQAAAEAHGFIKKQAIGQAECRFFKVKSVVGMYEKALRTDPLGLFGITNR
ncbi:MAG TPA: AAC(3) family N-acetyltransferase [Anaerolineae bacterium]|nr:AAC(3) family N-acetyltransferase [Anaerolineae bacterium]